MPSLTMNMAGGGVRVCVSLPGQVSNVVLQQCRLANAVGVNVDCAKGDTIAGLSRVTGARNGCGQEQDNEHAWLT